MWPTHYPEQCPPKEAFSFNGNLFRFINRNKPVQKDFKSYYDSKPGHDWNGKECQARGLSVYKTLEDCKEMMEVIPALRKKKLAVAQINENCGLLANTPSTNSERHCTWWIPASIIEPCSIFEQTSVSEACNV